MNSKSALIIIMVIGLFSCQRKLPHRNINDALRAAYTFQPGSYWVFRDSISGHADSLFVTGVHSNNLTDITGSYTFDLEDIDISTRNLDSMADSNQWVINLQESQVAISYDLRGGHKEAISFPGVTFPFGDATNSDNTVTTMDSYTTGSFTFKNVARVNFTSRYVDKSDIIYLSPDAGMVKIAFNHFYDSVYRNWQLQKYNIVK